MDHTGGYYMAMAILLALLHRERTGEGQWVDLACTEAALDAARAGAARLHRERPLAAAATGQPNSNRNAVAARWRRTASIPAPARTTGWRSPAATTPTGARLARGDRRAVDAMRRFATSLDGSAGEPGRARRARWAAGPRTRTSSTSQRRAARRRRSRARRCRRPQERIDHDPDTEASGCGRPSRTRRWARCGSTGCRCTCRGRTGRSSAARRASASTTKRCSAGCSGCQPRRRRAAARGGRRYDRARPGVRVHRAGERADRLRRQAAGRHGRRRDPGRAARRRSGAELSAVPRRRSPGPSGACGGGTTTPASAAWCSTSTTARGPRAFQALVGERRHPAGGRAARAAAPRSGSTTTICAQVRQD